MHGRNARHFFSYLTPFFLVICTLPALLTSLLIVCTCDCTPSCETCPRYFSCFRFKVYFQFLHTLPRDPWIPPPRYVSFKWSPLSYILIAIFLSSRWRSEGWLSGYLFPYLVFPQSIRNVLSTTKPLVYIPTPMD